MKQHLSAAVMAAMLAAFGGPAEATEASLTVAPASCAAPAGLMLLGTPLTRSAARIRSGETLTIVAVGSSSTEGIGASKPAMTYPTLLEAELKERYPHIPVRVLNRG